jgi:predicted amidohydrolase YtcJ
VRSLLILVAFAGSVALALAQGSADTVVTNGKILTVDADFRIVQALAIDNGRIVARGTSKDIARYVGPKTRVIDVAGATVIPGLIDNHFHLTRAVDRWHQQARFEGVDSRRKRSRSLPPRQRACRQASGSWCRVDGRRDSSPTHRWFTLEELDRAAPRNPLFVQEGYSSRLRQHAGAEGGRLEPGRWRETQRRGARVVPAAGQVARCDAAGLSRPARTEL